MKKPSTLVADFPKGGTRVHLRHFSKSLPMSLLRAREAVMRCFRPSLRQHEMTEQQWRVLRALNSVPNIEVTDLARATFLLGPSLSRILADLEIRRLIMREPDPRDLRRALISISQAGSDLIETVTPLSEAIYHDITQRFGEEKLAVLQSLLRELEEAAGDVAPQEESVSRPPPTKVAAAKLRARRRKGGGV